jgi:plastocyanin
MKSKAMVAVAGVIGLMGCGGGGATPAVQYNIFNGTLSITSALPAGITTCQGTPHAVSFTAAGSLPHTVSAAGGECVTFTNNDTVPHQPATYGAVSCPELNGPSLATGQSFTTAPLGGPKSCIWEDSLNPPGSAGGGAGY